MQTIALYEPVRLLAPRGTTLREARREFAACRNVTVIDAPVDDVWMRDIMPTFAWRGEGPTKEVVAIDWNFNGWGGTRVRPPRAGDRLAKTAAAIFGVPRIAASFVAEGGAGANHSGDRAQHPRCAANLGIATGLVVVGDVIGSGVAQEQAIVGETLLAARFQGVAEPNTVVIAESTRRLLGNLFNLQDLGGQDFRAWAVL